LTEINLKPAFWLPSNAEVHHFSIAQQPKP